MASPAENSALKTVRSKEVAVPQEDTELTFVLWEGSIKDHVSPVVVFVNDILLNMEMWNPVIELLMPRKPGWRYLRYNLRAYGPYSASQTDRVTLDMLAADLKKVLLDRKIWKMHCMIGMGLGAAVALTYLDQASAQHSTLPMAASFIGFSFPLPGSPVSSHQLQAKWDARRELARRYSMETTADKAVSRWFSPDARDSSEWIRVQKIVAEGSIEGMGLLSDAIAESVAGHAKYGSPNLKQIVAGLQIPTLFLSGSEDETFPEEMEEYPRLMKSSKGQFQVIPHTSRLACCEQPELFVEMLWTFWHSHGLV